jgi:hypothetical protein
MLLGIYINLFAIAAALPLHGTLFHRTTSRGNGPKPAAFFLAGDSTTAAQSDEGGGWGVGFLKTIRNDAIGTDLGYNGATTVSFVYGGAWANVIDAVNRSKLRYDPYVTIQVSISSKVVSHKYRKMFFSLVTMIKNHLQTFRLKNTLPI